MSQPNQNEIEELINNKKEELEAVARQIGATSLEQVFDFLAGRNEGVQSQIKSDLSRAANYVSGNQLSSTIDRFAGSQPVSIGMRVIPAAAAVGTLLGTGNILLGDESAGNKLMDTAAMVAPAIYGARKRGMLGGLAGAATGKIGSDVLQAILGGGA